MDKPTPSGGAAQKIEKQARQLAYDTRYKVKKSMKSTSGSRLDPAAVRRAYEAELSKSSAAPVVKKRARQMLLGEDYVMESKDLAIDNVANALYKVFVEGVHKEENPIVLPYMEEMETAEHRKYKVRVTDKKTNNSYVRYATREKIAELRANPNIASVEMTGHGEPTESEKKSGGQTSKAKAGKGLDPVGQEDDDIDNDGKKNTKTDKYLKHRRDVRGAAIAGKKGVSEEFLGELSGESSSTKPVDVMKGSNKVVISPPAPGTGKDSKPSIQMAHYDMEGSIISEKAVSQAQQKFMGMVYAAKKGAKPASPEVAKAASGISKGEAKKFAKTKHEGLPVHKEETECGKGEEDQRSFKTKVENIKNQLRSRGLKMSYEPEGEVLDELRRSEELGKGSPDTSREFISRAQRKERGPRGASFQHSGSREFGGSKNERGKKKNEPGSQHQRLNPPEEKGRQLKRGSAAARQSWHSARD